MHRGAVAGALLVGTALLCATAPAAAEKADSVGSTEVAEVDGWTLVLEEDFEQVDPDRWSLKDATYSSNEDSFLRARNCSIDDTGADGHSLRLQARQESVRRYGDTWEYTSCYATTEGRYSVPNYFRAEVRARVPMEQGMWAAPLWFRPSDGSGGEIDLVETLGVRRAAPRLSQTIHTDYGDNHEQAQFSYPFRRLGDADGTAWHTYTIEKLPGRITMWVDGVQTAQWSAADPLWFAPYYETGKSWDLRVNLQVGGSWGGPPDRTTDWAPDKTSMLVDRIHVWTPELDELLPLPPLGGTEGERVYDELDEDAPWPLGIPADMEPTESVEPAVRGEPVPTEHAGPGAVELTIDSVGGVRAALVGEVPMLTWTAEEDGPAAYAVYRDGQLLGETTRHWYVDSSPVEKTHVYEVRAADG